MPDGQLKPLTRHQPAAKVENGRQGATSTIDFIARQWASPSVKEQEYQMEALHQNRQDPESKSSVKKPPGLSILSRPPMDSIQNHALDQASDHSMGQPMDLDMFLSRLKTHMFSISCMVFQDAWNLDLERVQDCCIHVFSPDGRLIPFCMYNLTDVNGRSLYRKGW